MNINIIVLFIIAILIGIAIGYFGAKLHKGDTKAVQGCYAISITGIVMITMIFICMYNIKIDENYGWIENYSFSQKSHGPRTSTTNVMNIEMNIQTSTGIKKINLEEDRIEFLDIIKKGEMFTVAKLYSPITKDTTYKIIADGATSEAMKNNGYYKEILA